MPPKTTTTTKTTKKTRRATGGQRPHEATARARHGLVPTLTHGAAVALCWTLGADLYHNNGITATEPARAASAVVAPVAADYWKARGDALLEVGEVASALGAYDKALADDKSLCGAIYGRGVALERMSEMEPARDALLQAVACARRDAEDAKSDVAPEPVVRLAQVEAKLGEWASARDNFAEASDVMLRRRDKARAEGARLSSALAAFEAATSDDERMSATRIVAAEARRRSTAEIRVALVAMQWATGSVDQAEENWRICCADGCSAGTRQNAAALALDDGSAWGPRLKKKLRDFLVFSGAPADYPGAPKQLGDTRGVLKMP